MGKLLAAAFLVATSAFAADLKPVDDAALERELAKPGLVFLDVSAEWCGPCRLAKAALPEVAATRPDVRFLELDSPKSARFGSFPIPLFIVYRDGREVARKTGYREPEDLKALLEKLPR